MRPRKPEIDRPLPAGADEVDVAIAKVCTAHPGISDRKAAEIIQTVSEKTVFRRRHREVYLKVLAWLNPPEIESKTWRDEIKPLLRRRLAQIAVSKNDASVLTLARSVIPGEVASATDEPTESGLGRSTEVDRAFADWLRRGGGRDGAAKRRDGAA